MWKVDWMTVIAISRLPVHEGTVILTFANAGKSRYLYGTRQDEGDVGARVKCGETATKV